MTTVSPITATAANGADVTPAGAANSAAGDSAAALTGLDDFLLLLTTQLKFQDPLNPQDSSEFVAQLATFSSLEQQIGMNERLDQLIEEEASVYLADLATWVGQEVHAEGVGYAYDGATPVDLEVPERSDAETVSVVIRDRDNKEIATIPGDPDGGSVTWNGKTTDGSNAAEDVYYVSFVYGFGDQTQADEFGELAPRPDETVLADAFGLVREVRIEDTGEAVLVLESGQIVNPAAISGVRLTDPEPVE